MKMKKSILYTILTTLAIGCLSVGDSSQSKALETENVIAPKTTREVKEYSSTSEIITVTPRPEMTPAAPVIIQPGQSMPTIAPQRTASPDIPLNPEEKDENGKYVVRIYMNYGYGNFQILSETRSCENGEIIQLPRFYENESIDYWICQYQDQTVRKELWTKDNKVQDSSIEVNGSMKLTAYVSCKFPAMNSSSPIPTKSSTTHKSNSIIDRQKPVFKNLINKKTYYKKKVIAYVKDNKAIKKVTINGKKVKLTKVKKGKYKNYWKFTITRQKKITKYKIIAIDPSGNHAKRTIYLKNKKRIR